jgi:hypothetical protein
VVGHPFIRFYAGAPIRTKSGHNIGSICVVDYIPKALTESQRSALKEIAEMIMNDLQLHRNNELVEIRSCMADSITQFTRVLNKGDNNIPAQKKPACAGKRDSAELGVMDYYNLEIAQKAEDAAPSIGHPEERQPHTPFASSSSNNESDLLGNQNFELKHMYEYACRLIRETLGVEGVCFVDFEGVNLGHDTKAFANRVRGYSHSENKNKWKTWPRIEQWNMEAGLSSLDRPTQNDKTSNGVDSKTIGDHFTAAFLSKYPSGFIFNRGLPDELQSFLPPNVTSAIIVPVYGYGEPLSLIFAYSTDRHRMFMDEEKQYLQVHPPRSG